VDGSFQPVVNSYELGTSMPHRSRPPHHFFRKEHPFLPPIVEADRIPYIRHNHAGNAVTMLMDLAEKTGSKDQRGAQPRVAP
jgi:hypothetical protein